MHVFMPGFILGIQVTKCSPLLISFSGLSLPCRQAPKWDSLYCRRQSASSNQRNCACKMFEDTNDMLGNTKTYYYTLNLHARIWFSIGNSSCSRECGAAVGVAALNDFDQANWATF